MCVLILKNGLMFVRFATRPSLALIILLSMFILWHRCEKNNSNFVILGTVELMSNNRMVSRSASAKRTSRTRRTNSSHLRRNLQSRSILIWTCQHQHRTYPHQWPPWARVQTTWMARPWTAPPLALRTWLQLRTISCHFFPLFPTDFFGLWSTFIYFPKEAASFVVSPAAVEVWLYELEDTKSTRAHTPLFSPNFFFIRVIQRDARCMEAHFIGYVFGSVWIFYLGRCLIARSAIHCIKRNLHVLPFWTTCW